MKTLAAFIVALSLFSAVAAHAMTDVGPATNEVGHVADASPAFVNIAEFSDALLLPGASDQVREPEDTAFFWMLLIIMCVDRPGSC